MRRNYIFAALCLMLLPLLAMAQNSVTGTYQATDTEEALNAPDVMPEYPGGTQALMRFLAGEIKYPPQARANLIEGNVITDFVVTTTGEIGDVRVLKSVSPEIDAEAVRVIKLIRGFKPGLVAGKSVNVRYVLPLSFRLEDEVPEVTHDVLNLALDGDMQSQYTVGYCYFNGIGVPVDWVVAKYYLDRAAQQGHPEAIELLEKTIQRLKNQYE